MKILVTGGLGLVGKPLVARLLKHGHQVRVADLPAEGSLEGVDYRSCDITQYSAAREAVQDMEAIVHLAAVPAPSQAHGSEIMRINTTGTYNIYEAAANAGIRRLATASSINYLGYYYGTQEFPIQYLPLDEAHPNSTSDAYSLSKHITEQIAAYYWRRAGITSICLRLPAVIPQLDERMKRLRDGSLFASQFINGLLELP